jgi:hypothetical protein
MKHFLMCENPQCRFVLDCGGQGAFRTLAQIGLPNCPECGAQWSAKCPFCIGSLTVAWIDRLPHCSICRRRLRAEAAEGPDSLPPESVPQRIWVAVAAGK